MPETRFEIRWPDQTTESCYSPSTVIKDYLEAGHDYPLNDFLQRCDTALSEASERVRKKYGYACSAASDQKEQLFRQAADQPAGLVHVLRIQS
ncbi:MSMEG_0570 family nitrogen starvation response protein [Granulosicoccus sp. 3-233]|uniref:MSMEG_0570 family nitrogen starvation response protein n=1 Tax=Granulosicoccus sp. 3-233 TaxID=3417969 RepID=UPI003D3385BA